MRFIQSFLVMIMLVTCLPLYSQAPSFDEMEFEPDSGLTVYKPAGKNFAFIRSKRGTGGVNKNPGADAAVSMEVTEIVLVFTEQSPDAIASREEANRERWENLLMTYPELFQYSTTYKNFCQCSSQGDSEAFKKAQGFYVYVNGEIPKTEEPKVAENPPSPPPVTAKTEENPPPPKTPKTEEKPAVTKEEKAPLKEVAVDNTAVKTKEAPVKETVKENDPVPVNEEAPVVAETKPVKETPKKKAPSKVRRAKDPKACRPACYGWGDEDLIAFFKDNIELTKKQKRKAKKWTAQVRLQLDPEGVLKKAFVTGENEAFNQMLNDAIKKMNKWNPAVKSGVTVKSEVKFTMKYDKDKKFMKASDIAGNPRPSQKCPCVPDSEIFGD